MLTCRYGFNVVSKALTMIHVGPRIITSLFVESGLCKKNCLLFLSGTYMPVKIFRSAYVRTISIWSYIEKFVVVFSIACWQLFLIFDCNNRWTTVNLLVPLFVSRTSCKISWIVRSISPFLVNVCWYLTLVKYKMVNRKYTAWKLVRKRERVPWFFPEMVGVWVPTVYVHNKCFCTERNSKQSTITM
jgi:hypothetical protein